MQILTRKEASDIIFFVFRFAETNHPKSVMAASFFDYCRSQTTSAPTKTPPSICLLINELIADAFDTFVLATNASLLGKYATIDNQTLAFIDTKKVLIIDELVLLEAYSDENIPHEKMKVIEHIRTFLVYALVANILDKAITINQKNQGENKMCQNDCNEWLLLYL